MRIFIRSKKYNFNISKVIPSGNSVTSSIDNDTSSIDNVTSSGVEMLGWFSTPIELTFDKKNKKFINKLNK